MSASPKQIKMIEDMQLAGAPIPEHPQFDRPDDSMFHSAHQADAYIKANMLYFRKVVAERARNGAMDAFSNRVSAAEWGGISNH